jgi:hypothetical protein
MNFPEVRRSHVEAESSVSFGFYLPLGLFFEQTFRRLVEI